jgi:hypothetical protein
MYTDAKLSAKVTRTVVMDTGAANIQLGSFRTKLYQDYCMDLAHPDSIFVKAYPTDRRRVLFQSMHLHLLWQPGEARGQN